MDVQPEVKKLAAPVCSTSHFYFYRLIPKKMSKLNHRCFASVPQFISCLPTIMIHSDLQVQKQQNRLRWTLKAALQLRQHVDAQLSAVLGSASLPLIGLISSRCEGSNYSPGGAWASSRIWDLYTQAMCRKITKCLGVKFGSKLLTLAETQISDANKNRKTNSRK